MSDPLSLTPHALESVEWLAAKLSSGAVTGAAPGEWQHGKTSMTAIANAALDAILIMNPAGKISYWNPAAERIFGYTSAEALGRNLHELIIPARHVPAHLAAFPVFMKTGAGAVIGRTLDLDALTKDGLEIVVKLSLSAIQIDGAWHAVGILRDATAQKREEAERRRLERLVLHTQRLESLKTLAGNVAHDLNNSLAPILMGAVIIRAKYPVETKLLDMIETSAKRAAGMAKQLVTFSKGADVDRGLVHPDHLIKELDDLMQSTFPKNIRLIVNYDSQLPPVQGDATQLHQVLLNLCVNARDAMLHGGTLTLEAKALDVNGAHASSLPGAKPGKYLTLRVSDTGTGIAPEIIEQIFDPFFTTKSPDKGTGLGLAAVLGIVKGSGGFLRVDSKLGHGSTFTTYLPADVPDRDAAIAINMAGEFHGQGEMILFVDDEPQIREIARLVLRHLNVVPLTASDGADALMQALEHRSELRAIITDLQMPYMDGLTFVRELRRILPYIPVVVASGRVEDSVVAEFKALGVTSWLDKPFTEVRLAEALQAVLRK